MPDGEPLDFAALSIAVWRQKLLVGALGFAGALIAVGLALVTTPVFRAEIVVLETSDKNLGGGSGLSGQIGGLASLAGVTLSSGGADRDRLAVLQSRRLAQDFIVKNDLSKVLCAGADEHSSIWFAVEKFRNDVMVVRQNKQTGTISILIDWNDAAVAAAWANKFIALANETLRSRAIDEATRNVAFLGGQISKTNVLEIQRSMYGLIEGETKTLMMANGRVEYAFTIIDPAVPPEERIRPKRSLMVLAGLLGGLLLGIAIALVRSPGRRAR